MAALQSADERQARRVTGLHKLHLPFPPPTPFSFTLTPLPRPKVQHPGPPFLPLIPYLKKGRRLAILKTLPPLRLRRPLPKQKMMQSQRD